MTLSNFIGTVRKIDYKTITEKESAEPKKYYTAIELEAFYDIFGDTITQIEYYAEVKVEASKRGKSKPSKHDVWSCIIYLTQDQFAEQEIEVGDIIEVDRPTLKKKDIKFFIYDPEKLKELPPSKLHYKFTNADDCDDPDKPAEGCPKCPHKKNCPDKRKHYNLYSFCYASDCRLSARGYKILYKADEVFRGSVGGVKISFENGDEMKDFTEGEYFITPEEAVAVNKAIANAAGKPLEMRFFSKRAKVRTALVECTLSYDDTANSNLLNISVV